MAKQALFYERVTPISLPRHRDWCVDAIAHYEFARNVNSVPLMTAEMAIAAREYTIVFGGTEKSVQPIVLQGVDNNSNVYVTEDGSWAANYIPAFVRRYPFVFADGEKPDTYTLCIDEAWSGCNQSGQGQRLFDDQGKGSPYLDRMIGFGKEYLRQAQRTQAFCHKLKSLNLLDSNTLQFTLPGDQQRSLRGFMAVNPEKLKALPAETLHELAQSDDLQLIYTHLLSMNNLSLMFDRLAKLRADLAPAATA